MLIRAVLTRAALTRPMRALAWTVLSWMALGWLTLAELTLADGTARAQTRLASAAPEERCSWRRPVCVVGLEGQPAEQALFHLEAALEHLVLGGQGPAHALSPLSAPLVWAPSRESFMKRALTVAVDPAPSRGFERARARCDGGAATRANALSCVARATLLEIAPRTLPSLAAGFAAYVASELADGDEGFLAQARAARTPERGFLDAALEPAAAFVFERLGARAEPSRRVPSVWTALLLAPSRAPPRNASWNPEPDFFDVLRSSFSGPSRSWGVFFAELAEVRFESARPDLAWDIESSTLPRNLVLPEPLWPTGSAYVRVGLDESTRRAGLALRTYCERGPTYVWSMLRVDDRGRVLGRVLLPIRDGSETAEGSLRELQDAQAVIVIGTSLGGQGPSIPFDPDLGSPEPHACEVVLNRLGP